MKQPNLKTLPNQATHGPKLVTGMRKWPSERSQSLPVLDILVGIFVKSV